MSVFDENKIEGSPITARILQEILAERKVNVGDSDIDRYNKILQHILNLVKYNPDKDIWEHRICLAALDIHGSPFTVDFTSEINKKIREGESTEDIIKWINKEKIQPCDKLKKFAKFFKDRGFSIYFRTQDYMKSEDRDNDKLITISWDKDE